MTTKAAPIKQGPPKEPYETADNLLAAIEICDCTPGHIHEGPIDPTTGYPSVYYVCDGDCD